MGVAVSGVLTASVGCKGVVGSVVSAGCVIFAGSMASVADVVGASTVGSAASAIFARGNDENGGFSIVLIESA